MRRGHLIRPSLLILGGRSGPAEEQEPVRSRPTPSAPIASALDLSRAAEVASTDGAAIPRCPAAATQLGRPSTVVRVERDPPLDHGQLVRRRLDQQLAAEAVQSHSGRPIPSPEHGGQLGQPNRGRDAERARCDRRVTSASRRPERSQAAGRSDSAATDGGRSSASAIEGTTAAGARRRSAPARSGRRRRGRRRPAQRGARRQATRDGPRSPADRRIASPGGADGDQIAGARKKSLVAGHQRLPRGSRRPRRPEARTAAARASSRSAAIAAASSSPIDGDPAPLVASGGR